MNKILRFISTLAVAAGLVLLYVYFFLENGIDKLQALSQASYYTVQDYRFLFFGSIGCIILSILSAFLSWNKKLDPKQEAALPNAVGAGRADLMAWLSGSTLDTGKERAGRKAVTEQPNTAAASDGSTVKSGTAQSTQLTNDGNTVLAGAGLTVSGNGDSTIAQATGSTVLAEDATVLVKRFAEATEPAAGETVSEATVCESPVSDQTVMEGDENL